MKRLHLTRRQRASLDASVPFGIYPRVMVGRLTRKQRERNWASVRGALMAKLIKTRDGRTLCWAHANTGAPAYHTEGCDACAAARANGIVRPDAGSVPPKQRGRRRHLEAEDRAVMGDAVDRHTRNMG